MALRFEELIERHHDEIFAYLWKILGKNRRGDGALDVEDLVQEVFLRAYQAFTALRPNSNHRAWLYKIATNCAYTKLRRERLSARDELAAELLSETESPSFSDGVERKVRVLVEGLPAKQRICVTLRYLQDLDYPEIARIAGCSQESARANVSQAIRRLRVLLEKET
jgi:RNA polymerase sigma-70 factor (ECF subfamily)